MRALLAATVTAAFFAASPPASAERVCVEEVGGVCLKYRNADPAPQPSQPAAPRASTQSAPTPSGVRLNRADRRAVQRGLAASGYYRGGIDGALGPQSQRAIRAWQAANGYASTGNLTRAQANQLIAIAPQAATAPANNNGGVRSGGSRDGAWRGRLKCAAGGGSAAYFKPGGLEVGFQTRNGSGSWSRGLFDTSIFSGDSFPHDRIDLSLSPSGSAVMRVKDRGELEADEDCRGDELRIAECTPKSGGPKETTAGELTGRWGGGQASFNGRINGRSCSASLTRY